MWFWLSLASALLGAVDIILNKKLLHKVSPVVLSWALDLFSIPILIPLALREGIPSINSTFWIAVILSCITFAVGRTLYNDALRKNLVFYIIPITAFSGVFVYIFGLIMLSESITLVPFLGLLLVLAGSYILNVDQAREDALKPFKLLFANKVALLFLFALVLMSLTAVFDKMGVINTTPVKPLFVLLLEQIIMTAILTIYLVARERQTWIPQVKSNFKLLAINTFVYVVIGYFVYSAYGLEGPVALVIGIKRLQIFFALALGYFFLKEKFGKHIWIATAVMIIGTILIKIG